MKKKLLASIAILSCICLAACGNDKPTGEPVITGPIVGKWQDTVDGVTTIEFKDDGSFVVTGKDGAANEDGTYRLEEDKIVITSNYQIDGETRIDVLEGTDNFFVYEIDGILLTLITGFGDRLDLARIT